jgi:hypothetical protein
MSAFSSTGNAPYCAGDVMGQRTKSLRDRPLRGDLGGDLIMLNPLRTQQGYIDTVSDLD